MLSCWLWLWLWLFEIAGIRNPTLESARDIQGKPLPSGIRTMIKAEFEQARLASCSAQRQAWRMDCYRSRKKQPALSELKVKELGGVVHLEESDVAHFSEDRNNGPAV